MAEVTIRELRNHGGDVVDRVARGEQITITRAGKPVAQLRPVAAAAVPSEVLVARWRRLPPVDPAALHADTTTSCIAVCDGRAGRKATARAYDAMIAATA